MRVLVYSGMVSGGSEGLTSPSVFLRVRDLHVNVRALSTGEPEEAQTAAPAPHMYLPSILLFTSRLIRPPGGRRDFRGGCSMNQPTLTTAEMRR